MSDQAKKLRELSRQSRMEVAGSIPAEVLPLVALLGSRGGVGVSTVAMEIARQLAEGNYSPVLVDGNLHQPKLAALAGITVDLAGDLSDVLCGDRTVNEVLRPTREGFPLVPGGWALYNDRVTSDLAQRTIASVQQLTGEGELAIVDAGSALTPWCVELLTAADLVLMIAEATPAAVLDTYAKLKLIYRAAPQVRLEMAYVHCGDIAHAARAQHALAQTCGAHLGRIPPMAAALYGPKLTEANYAPLVSRIAQLAAPPLVFSSVVAA